ncbi:MAG TPA: HAD family hydrolase [Rickettsiales bacterium]|nr:HAD family hydrolase [Rickettsiales bacterium]
MSSADSPGRSIPVNDIVLVCDLDETLLDCNSFPRWVRFMLNGQIAGLGTGGRLALSLRAGSALAWRKAKFCSHYAMKRRLQGIWTEALKGETEAAALQSFFDGLRPHLRPGLAGILKMIADGKVESVLASAAAAEYAEPFGHSLGFRHVLATPRSGQEAVEFRGQEKRDRVLAWLKAQGLSGRKRIFLTDHEEDMPFMKESHLVLWFGKPEDVEGLQAQAGVRIVACRDMTAAQIEALLQ